MPRVRPAAASWPVGSEPPVEAPRPVRGGGIASTAAPGPDDAPCRRRPRIERVRARPLSTSGRARRSGLRSPLRAPDRGGRP